MKPDLYTKTLFTIATIAISILAINALQHNFIPTAQAKAQKKQWNCFEYKTISSGDANLIAGVLNKKDAEVGFSGTAGNIGFTCYR